MNTQETIAPPQLVGHTVQPFVRLCVNCDDEIPRNKANRLFCSRKCQSEFKQMKERLDARQIWWSGVWMRDVFAIQDQRYMRRDGFFPGQIQRFICGVQMRKHLHA